MSIKTDNKVTFKRKEVTQQVAERLNVTVLSLKAPVDAVFETLREMPDRQTRAAECDIYRVDGKASERLVDALEARLEERSEP